MSDAIPSFVATRGVPLRLAIQIDLTDPSGWTVVAKVKPQAPNRALPGPEVRAVLTFSVSFEPAANGDRAYFRLNATAAQTQALAAGQYVMDAVFIHGAEVVSYARPVSIDMRNRIS